MGVPKRLTEMQQKFANLLVSNELEHDLGFIEKNPKFIKNVSKILGRNYEIIKKSIIRSVPFSMIPKWLTKKLEDKLKKMTEITVNEDVTNLSGVPSWTLILLHKILENTGKSSILDIWPNLEVFFHGGVNFTPYRKEFKQLIPSDKMHYLETYNASEGFFGIQDQKNSEEL